MSRSLLIFYILSALFILSMFYRVSNAVIAPNLIQDLGLDAEALASLEALTSTPLLCFRFQWDPCSTESVPALLLPSFSLIGASVLFSLPLESHLAQPSLGGF